MKRIALIAAAVILTACGGAKDEAAEGTEGMMEEAPAAMVDSATTMMTDSTMSMDSTAMPATPDSGSM